VLGNERVDVDGYAERGELVDDLMRAARREK
jgi:hypothetical protein